MPRLLPGLMTLVLAMSCQKEKLESTTEEGSAPAQAAEQQPVTTEPVKKEPVKKEPDVTCDSLGIPSYELWISELSTLRCESCHNDRLAFKGIKFLSYEDWKAVAEAAKNRIATNALTKPLDPIEQGIFLDWFDKGMPNTEKDCANKG
ncbi:MAG TPA: hypothetical protein VFO10_22255 [Oligoflexus sp.]|uniref:hypothetical protein n=1 Tax=Oligoflexus sp. TaxID=1971216 RepID=UPI002D80EC94|nr:hypothetical protein [Oligoflexus sp.]HET9240001.1 hypothetical protein [Oligoflexus sp.]